MMRNKYFALFVIGFLIWVSETIIFGFNAEPQSGIEGFLDTASLILMGFGAIGDLLTNLRIHKHYHNVTTIRTNKVSIKDGVISYHVNFKNSDKAKS